MNIKQLESGIVFTIQMEFNNEQITIVPFHMLDRTTGNGFYNKIVIVGRVPTERQNIMKQLQQLLQWQ